MGRLIEGFWDCPYCDQKRIRGLETTCPHCNTPRGELVEFYLGDTTNFIDDETAKTISENPDWVCDCCSSLNSDRLIKCDVCGAPREKSKLDYFENRQKQDAHEAKVDAAYSQPPKEDVHHIAIEEQGIENQSTKNEQVVAQRQSKAKTTPKTVSRATNKTAQKKTLSKALKISAIALSAILLLSALVMLFIPKEQNGTVEAFAWEYTINIEEYKTFHESDWLLPQGARLEYTAQEIRTYKQVLDHYETKTRTYTEQVLDHYETVVTGYRDNGNGTFTEITSQQPVYRTEIRTETYQEPVYRSEPVYDTKYYYEVDRWTHSRTVKTDGNDKTPYWGESGCSPKEREGSRMETYKITILTEEGSHETYAVKKDVWEKLQAGETVKLKVYITGYAELIT